MDVKESIKKLIKQSTELLNKLEADESVKKDNEDISSDIEFFDEIIEKSKTIATELKSKHSKPRRNGNVQSTSEDSQPTKIKLVPIEKLVVNSAKIVLDKTTIELSDSDSDAVVESVKPKSGDSVQSTSKASILKGVFNPVREIATTNHVRVNRSVQGVRDCTVNLTRTDLSRVVASKGLELMPTLMNDASATKPAKTVRSQFFYFLLSHFIVFLGVCLI